MNIGFDGRRLSEHSGINTYTRNLIQAMLLLPEPIKFTLFSYRRRKRIESLADMFDHHPAIVPLGRFPNNLLLGHLGKPLIESFTPFIWRREAAKVDLVHCTDPGFFPDTAPNIVTNLHDLFPLYDDAWMLQGSQKEFIKNISSVIRNSRLIITPTEFVRRDLITRLAVPEKKIIVTLYAADAIFQPQAVWWKKLERFGLKEGEKFFLSVGRIDPRKNVAGMLEAYTSLPVEVKREVKFILIAGGGAADHAKLQTLLDKTPEPNLLHFSGVSNDDLVNLYNAATGLLFASFAEGFGLPALEAMQSGCAVITSNTSSLPEIVGDAALLVDPHSASEIRSAMLRIATEDDLRQSMRRKGLEQAKKFSWRNTAIQTLQGYRDSL
ncbi:MAG: glycosyltransferase family 4 protein [Rhizobacter sp.]|nr:glycosyltransferase family 4 protein [Chlorobiales bacterium]